MKIDGKAIAEKMLMDLTVRVTKLKQNGVTPTLVVILVWDNPASLSYIKQKKIAAEKIGASLVLSHQLPAVSNQQLRILIEQYNNDPSVHGIIIQRPLPPGSTIEPTILSSVIPEKDVDGFVQESPFEVPVASAVMTILNFTKSHPAKDSRERPLEEQDIVVIGRGETAGKPIANLLVKKGCKVTVVHSQTNNPDEIIRAADVVISCVGKPNVVRRDNIKKDAILLSVGIWRDNEGKVHGDYDEDDIEGVSSFYTPTPGGIGPLNVACLLSNLVVSAQNIT